METDIYELQQHVQRIEDLSNQLLSLRQDSKEAESLIKELDQENAMLQEKKKRLQENLKVETETN